VPQDFNSDRMRIEWRGGPDSVISPLHADDYDNLNDGSIGYVLVAQFQTSRLVPWIDRPFLSYAVVNPPVQIYARQDRAGSMPRLEPWRTAPHYPESWRVRELVAERVAANGQRRH
jgi:hypothetical protein